MTDPDRLAEWFHLDGTVCVAGHHAETSFCVEGHGPVMVRPVWAEIARLRALLEPSVTMTSPTVYDPGNDESAPPKEGAP